MWVFHHEDVNSWYLPLDRLKINEFVHSELSLSDQFHDTYNYNIHVSGNGNGSDIQDLLPFNCLNFND